MEKYDDFAVVSEDNINNLSKAYQESIRQKVEAMSKLNTGEQNNKTSEPITVPRNNAGTSPINDNADSRVGTPIGTPTVAPTPITVPDAQPTKKPVKYNLLLMIYILSLVGNSGCNNNCGRDFY